VLLDKIDTGNTKRLVFSKNWNNKLLCFVFTTIRPNSNKYKEGDIIDVRINERFFCYAKVLGIQVKTISELIAAGHHRVDTGLSGKEFFELMDSFYSKKIWWKGIETEMQIIFFEKIVQLDIFDQGA